jgi:hypothetical protein
MPRLLWLNVSLSAALEKAVDISSREETFQDYLTSHPQVNAGGESPQTGDASHLFSGDAYLLSDPSDNRAAM